MRNVSGNECRGLFRSLVEIDRCLRTGIGTGTSLENKKLQCPNCAQPMYLTRIQHNDDRSTLMHYECKPCGVGFSEALDKGPDDRTVRSSRRLYEVVVIIRIGNEPRVLARVSASSYVARTL